MPRLQDPPPRALAIAIVCSILLHLLLLAPVFLGFPLFGTPMYVKKGEPLFVDIAPDRPEEKAPLGNPSRPVGPDATEREEPKPVTPPAPKLAEAPKPPAPRIAPRPAEPPRQVAKAEPRATSPAPRAQEPEPAPAAAQPTQPAQPETSPSAGQASQPSAPSQPSNPQVATARPPSIFRPPAGGGGLRGGGFAGVEGEPIPLDTPEPKYQDYFNKIREKIKANWIYPYEAGSRGVEGDLNIEFVIAKDGHLQFIELRRSSQVGVLDAAALNAVKLAQPFPPVPDALAKQALAINGLFVYRIREDAASLVNRFR
ncbi:MAG TPA: TonB family protein, partial [Methylomirabilota bacterium]|nr:TonB family protein [Methylomirabilota bacterium]